MLTQAINSLLRVINFNNQFDEKMALKKTRFWGRTGEHQDNQFGWFLTVDVEPTSIELQATLKLLHPRVKLVKCLGGLFSRHYYRPCLLLEFNNVIISV